MSDPDNKPDQHEDADEDNADAGVVKSSEGEDDADTDVYKRPHGDDDVGGGGVVDDDHADDSENEKTNRVG